MNNEEEKRRESEKAKAEFEFFSSRVSELKSQNEDAKKENEELLEKLKGLEDSYKLYQIGIAKEVERLKELEGTRGIEEVRLQELQSVNGKLNRANEVLESQSSLLREEIVKLTEEKDCLNKSIQLDKEGFEEKRKRLDEKDRVLSDLEEQLNIKDAILEKREKLLVQKTKAFSE